MTDWIFFGISAAFALIGICAFAAAAIGSLRVNHVLYRMHLTAVADTVGIACITVSACVYLGASLVTLKELLVIALLMLTSPVSTHLLAEIEYSAGNWRRAGRPVDGADEESGVSKEEER